MNGKLPRGRPWPKGKSGNPRGRPKGSGLVDPAAILAEPVKVRTGEETRSMAADEVMEFKRVSRALKGDLRSITALLKGADSAGLLVRAPDPTLAITYYIPKEWDPRAWHRMFKTYGPPPWPGELDGLIPADRQSRRRGHVR